MRASFAAVIALAVVAAPCAQDRPGAPRPSRAESRGPALDEIRGEDIAAHIKFLSDDLLERRAPSTRGGRLAALYLATQLATLGYGPAGDHGTVVDELVFVGRGIVAPEYRWK